jgi:hypothetical protein
VQLKHTYACDWQGAANMHSALRSPKTAAHLFSNSTRYSSSVAACNNENLFVNTCPVTVSCSYLLR